jgi:large repetitive protein
MKKLSFFIVVLLLFSSPLNQVASQSTTPGPAGPITGSSSICIPSSGVIYSIAAIPSATAYVWTIPPGSSITAGAGTKMITVDFPSGSASGNVSVYGKNTSGAGLPSKLFVTTSPRPVPKITGPTPVCNLSAGNIYSTEPGMSNYMWNIPAGATVAGGNNLNSNTATITWTVSGTQVIRVNYTNANGCAASVPSQFNVTVNPVPIPAITGPASVCVNVNTVYSTVPWQTNYVWTISPSGTIVSGQSTKTVTVKWSTQGSHWIGLNYTNLNGCLSPSPTIKNVTVSTCN